MKKIYASLITIIILYIITLISYRFYLYNLVYKYAGDVIKPVRVVKIETKKTEFKQFFGKVYIAKDLYDRIDHNMCSKTTEKINNKTYSSMTCSGSKDENKIAIIIREVKEYEFEEEVQLNYLSKIKGVQANTMVKKMNIPTNISYGAFIAMNGNEKINLFSNIEKIKSEALKKSHFPERRETIKLYQLEDKRIISTYLNAFLEIDNYSLLVGHDTNDLVASIKIVDWEHVKCSFALT